MANETVALVRQRQPAASGEGDYQSFCAALSSSGRGRAFLAEYAKRNRNADTEVLLAALDRLEVQMRSRQAESEAEKIRRGLVALHDAIQIARREIDSGEAADRAAKRAVLLEHIEHHLAAMLAPADAGGADLPIPSPANDETRSAALMFEPEIPRRPSRPGAAPASSRPRAVVPEVNYFDDAPPDPPAAPALAETPEIATAAPPAAEAAPATAERETAMSVFAAQIELPGAIAEEETAAAPVAAPEKPRADPLAAIMALSEEERLALFT